MIRVFHLASAFAVLLCASSLTFAQVNFEVFGNGGDMNILPEEDDGWDGDMIRIAHDGNGGVSNGVNFDAVDTGLDFAALEFDFEFQIWNEDGNGDADGIGFAYADIELFGEEADDSQTFWGGGEEPNLDGSVGVGFDTWMNTALDDDERELERYCPDDPDCPPDDNGNLPGGQTLPNSFSLHFGQRLSTFPIEDVNDSLSDDWIQNGNVKHAHIALTSDGEVTVRVTDRVTGEVATPYENELIEDYDAYEGRLVFKARTGGEDSNHDIDNISITKVAADGTRETFVHYGRYIGGPVGPECDFDESGVLDVGDIDAMLGVVKAGTNEARFDLTGDGLVDANDIVELVQSPTKFNTYIGDANLDGEFNSSDFVDLFTAGQYQDGVAMNSTWATGDFNGDAEFDSSDFVAAFTQGGYELGPRAAASAVPEPSGLALLLIGLLGLRRRRS